PPWISLYVHVRPSYSLISSMIGLGIVVIMVNVLEPLSPSSIRWMTLEAMKYAMAESIAPSKPNTVDTSMNTNMFRKRMKSLVPNGSFLDRSTANISMPSSAPPLRSARPIPVPMMTPPTIVTSSESPSMIAGIWCIMDVNMARENMPTLDNAENLAPICLYPSQMNGMFNTAIRYPSLMSNILEPTMLTPVIPPSETWLGINTDSSPYAVMKAPSTVMIIRPMKMSIRRDLKFFINMEHPLHDSYNQTHHDFIHRSLL